MTIEDTEKEFRLVQQDYKQTIETLEVTGTGPGA